jgi:uncharacterized protein (DUF2267 family)
MWVGEKGGEYCHLQNVSVYQRDQAEVSLTRVSFHNFKDSLTFTSLFNLSLYNNLPLTIRDCWNSQCWILILNSNELLLHNCTMFIDTWNCHCPAVHYEYAERYFDF